MAETLVREIQSMGVRKGLDKKRSPSVESKPMPLTAACVSLV